MEKVALDSAAKNYWADFYGEYGEALTRDIPRRIKAALEAKKKVASVDESADIRPLAHARHAEGIILEGMYKDQGTKLLFRATLNSVGDVEDIQTIEIK